MSCSRLRCTLLFLILLIQASPTLIHGFPDGRDAPDISELMVFAPQEGDTILFEMLFSEPMSSVEGEFVSEGLNRRIPLEGMFMTSRNRNKAEWKAWIPVASWARERNRLAGNWVGLEDENGLPSQTGGRAVVGSIHIAPFKDAYALADPAPFEAPGHESEAPRRFAERFRSEVDSRPDSAHWRLSFRSFGGSDTDRAGDHVGRRDTIETSSYDPAQNATARRPIDTKSSSEDSLPGSDLQSVLLQMAAHAESRYSDPRLVCLLSNFIDPRPSLQRVEWTAHSLAEKGPLVFLSNDGAILGSNCSKELREAARSSGGGYYAGTTAEEVESLHRVVIPILSSRALLIYADGRGAWNSVVSVDSTVKALDIVVSMTGWSQPGILAEKARGRCPAETNCYLIDPTGGLHDPEYSGTRVVSWHVVNPSWGRWEIGVSADEWTEYSVVARGESSMTLRLLSTDPKPEGIIDTIAVKLEWGSLREPEFDLIDPEGYSVSNLMLDYETRRGYSGKHRFDSPGHFRVRVRGYLGNQYVERLTELCVHVRPRPRLSLTVEDVDPDGDFASWRRISWSAWSPQRLATVTIRCDDDTTYAGNEPILSRVSIDDPCRSLVWSTQAMSSTSLRLWAIIDDGLNTPLLVSADLAGGLR